MYKSARWVKLKLISLLKNLLYLTICVAFFYTYPISSELVTDAYDEEGDLLLYFHAQRSFQPLDIVLYISEKGQDGIHPYVVLIVWDCEKRVDDMYGWFDSIFFSNEKARVLRECKEDTESIRQALYDLQGISAEHSLVKRRLDELKNEVNIHMNHIRNVKEDLKSERLTHDSLYNLKVSLISLLDYQNQSNNFLIKIRNYLSQNQMDTIDQWIHFFQNFHEDNEIFENILSELKLFQSTTTGDRDKILNALNSFFIEDSNSFLNLSDEDKSKINSLQDDLFEAYKIMDRVINLEYLIEQSIENWTLDDVQSHFSDFEKSAKNWFELSYTLRKQQYYSIMKSTLEIFFQNKMTEVPNEIKEIISNNSEPELHQIEQLVDFIQSKESSNYISSYLNSLYSSYASSYFRYVSLSNSPLYDEILLHIHRFQNFLLKIKYLFNIDEIQRNIHNQDIEKPLTLNTDDNESYLMNIINNMKLLFRLLSTQNIHYRINKSIDEVIELFAQMEVKVNDNYKKSSSYKLFEAINAMVDHHGYRLSVFNERFIRLNYEIKNLKDEIKNNQEDLLEVWGIKDKTQLDFTESIPAFSFSFMLYPLPVWALSDEEIEWMRRQDAFIRAFNRMRETGRRAYGR